MHEIALAEAVVRAVRKKGIINPKIVLGELQSIDEGIFGDALASLGLKNFRVEPENAEFACNICSGRWKLSDVELSDDERESIHFIPEVVHALVRCPFCSRADFKIVKGRGVSVGSEKRNN